MERDGSGIKRDAGGGKETPCNNDRTGGNCFNMPDQAKIILSRTAGINTITLEEIEERDCLEHAYWQTKNFSLIY